MIKAVQGPETSVHLQVVVHAPIERAFRTFTNEFDRIKPREHNMLGVDIAETVFEPRVGGHVYDRGVDGSECRWARVLAYEPPHRVVISWDISPQWQIEPNPERTSEVEIRFIAESSDRTRVEPNTAISTAMVRGGKRNAKGSGMRVAGRSTCSGLPTCSTPSEPGEVTAASRTDHAALVDALRRRVLEEPGPSDPALRQAVARCATSGPPC